MADTFHEATVASDHERVVVHYVVAEAAAQVTFGKRHADCVGETLSERTGSDLDPSSVANLGVAGRRRFPLAELLQVLQLKPIASKEQERVLQDRRVSVGENESVAIWPMWVRRIVPHHPAVQHMGEGCERHRRALVTALGLQRRIHRHPADERDRLLFNLRSEGARHAVDCICTVDNERLTRHAAVLRGAFEGLRALCARQPSDTQAGGSSVNGTRCHGPRSTRQWAKIWP